MMPRARPEQLLLTTNARLFCGIVLTLLSALGRAENALFVIPFGGEPGALIPHAYDYGAAPFTTGTYAMRIPNVDSEVSVVFTDTELTIDAKTKVVTRIHAERAYRAVGECETAKNALLPKLASALPAPYASGSPQWRYQSADGTQVGGVYCKGERYLPYPTLILDLTTASAAKP